MFDIVTEYKELLARKHRYETELPNLPKGSISNKTINGKKYCYLQSKSDGKVSSEYIASEAVALVKRQIALRKQYEAELPSIKQRLLELEQAAKLIGNGADRTLMLLKTSAGMDEIEPEKKRRCISFANAMNAIEGIPVSRQTAVEITAWQNGTKSFQSVFVTTLQRYGFIVEASV